MLSELRTLSPEIRTVGLVGATVAGLALVAGILAGIVLDRPFGDLSRDPTAVLEGAAYVGFLSTVGVIGWATGCGACLIASFVLRGRLRDAFIAGGLLTALLMADDAFLIHESYVEGLGIPVQIVPLAYGVLVIAYIVVFREFLRAHGMIVLLGACALFAFSAALDLTLDEDAPFVLEDGAKLFGIVAWSSFFVGAAVRSLRETARASA